MFRFLSHFLVWLLGAVVPVIIACAYGTPFRFAKSGKVQDATTKNAIPGIQVSCLQDGQSDNETWTDTDGQFYLEYNECSELKFEDIDGTENGEYESHTTALGSPDQEITVELQPKS
jgi:putative lipoprotein (rSAM/lipoprotein system)